MNSGEIIPYLLLFLMTLFCAWLGTAYVRKLLIRFAIMDVPNARSSHQIPTPRGGGIATTIVLIGMLILGHIQLGEYHDELTILIMGCLFLGLLSFIDDKRGLPFSVRLIAQFLTVISTIVAVDGFGFELWGILIIGFLWVGYTNAYNFMDGIDGITAAQTAHIGLCCIILSFLHHELVWMRVDGAILLGIALGFGIMNWHPAKIFMGDVGSIPLGFFTGYVILKLVSDGYFFEALVIPSYYLLDSGVTLAKRIMKKERFWEAHKSHFYQQAAQLGKTHSKVVLHVVRINFLIFAALIMMAWWQSYANLIALISYAMVFLLMFAMLSPWNMQKHKNK